MKTHKERLYQAVLERMSRGAVPMDGILWLDPKLATQAQAVRSEQARLSDDPRRNRYEYCSD